MRLYANRFCAESSYWVVKGSGSVVVYLLSAFGKSRATTLVLFTFPILSTPQHNIPAGGTCNCLHINLSVRDSREIQTVECGLIDGVSFTTYILYLCDGSNIHIYIIGERESMLNR